MERTDPTDLSTHIIPFSLRRAILEGDPASNLELQPGDVVTVFSQPEVMPPTATQTRLVSLEGEINAPGIYQLLPGETLKSLVVRAGGTTPHAYFYGLELVRESTRRQQRTNLDAAIARLEARSLEQRARAAANADTGSAARAAQATDGASRVQIEALRRLRPNGRMALDMDPQVSMDGLPEAPLEAADRITVPARPGFVTVTGAVADSVAFVWRSGLTPQDYLRRAGVEESMDLEHLLVLQANGVMRSRSSPAARAKGDLLHVAVQPGDSIIVPRQTAFETLNHQLISGAKEVAKVFGDFGIPAATIKSIQNLGATP